MKSVPLSLVACCAMSVAAVLVRAGDARAQDPSPPKATGAAQASGTAQGNGATQANVERLESWPKPANKDVLQKDIERVCKASIPEMAIAGRDAIVSVGAPAVPLVLERYGKERDAAAALRLREVLIALTKPEQSRLLGKEFDSRLAPVRTFTLWRVAEFRDAGVLPAFEATWARIEKQGDKIDAEERYAAALCGASAGSMKGLDVLFGTATTSWEQRGTEIRHAVESIRSREASSALGARFKQRDRKTTVTALRLLAGCGDKQSVSDIWPHLESTDNGILVAAINALRGVVDGDPPIDQMSAFEAIELAKKWKTKF